MFHWLGSAHIPYTDTPHTHRGDLGTACRGHVEVCAAVAQPESRSTASSTSPLPAQGDQIPGSQPSHIETPPRIPKCKIQNEKFQKHTSERGRTTKKEDGIPLRAEFGELFRGFRGFYFLTPLYFLSILWVSYWPPSCRSDGGSSEPRWPWPLPGDCAGAAGGCSGIGPVRRSGRPALPGPVLLYRDYSGLSRPRAPQRAQEHTPQHGETVSTVSGGQL